jgi:hypothetical protein
MGGRTGAFVAEHVVDGEDQYLVIAVDGLGVVQVKRQADGIVVDVFGLEDAHAPVASCWADRGLLVAEEED